MEMNTLKDIKDLKGKKILLRVDFNVPLDKNGNIEDDTRMVESLPTIKYLHEHKAKIIIMSHLGRPDGKVKKELSLTKIGRHLAKLLGKPIKKLDEVLGKEVSSQISDMKDGEIILLENIRFRPEEEECEKNFTEELSKLGDIFVNDAFGTAHRKHASTAGLADFLPSYAGLLMEKEINALSTVVDQEPMKPLTMIFGGAKIDTKIGIIKNFLNKADYFLMGGGLANTFLSAAGYNIGKSLCEEDKLDMAREIMLECEKDKEKFVLPHDVIVSEEISDNAETLHMPIEDVSGNLKILDIGEWSAEKYGNIIAKSKTIIWNGPLGVYEFKPFRTGTKAVARAMTENKCISIIGGGDTADCIKKLGFLPEQFTHVSTGGGACIEFLSGEKLQGIECLRK